MNIYIAKNQVKHGPFSIDEICNLIRNGEYLMSDLAWREGMVNWQPIHTIEDIVEAVLPPVPPVLHEIPVVTLSNQPPPIPIQVCVEGNAPPPISPCAEEKTLPPPTQGATNREDIIRNSLYLYIPTSRLIVLTVISAGLYPSYWIFHNWRYIKQRDKTSIRPFWRGIFGWFYLHQLLLEIQNDNGTNRLKKCDFSPDLLAAGWIVFTAIGIIFCVMPGFGAAGQLIGILTSFCAIVFFVRVQKYINSINELLPTRPSYYKISKGHIVCIIYGVISWIRFIV